MKLLKIKIDNFLGVGNAELPLNIPDITLIYGNNNDSKTSSSNGAGKSSIFEAIYYALYGKTKRGMAGDDVINRHNKKAGCSVDIVFEIAGKEFSIIRYRGKKEHGSGVKLFQGDDDISKGTSALTQELIENLIKINPVVFERCAFMGQGDIKPFASLTDRELKSTFEDALGLRFFSETNEKLKFYKTKLEEDKFMQESSIATANREIENIKKEIEHNSEKAAYMENNYKTMLKSVNDELACLAEEAEYIKTCKSVYEGESAGMYTHEIREAYKEELQALSSKIKTLEEMKLKLMEKINGKTGELAGTVMKINISVSNEKELQDAIKKAVMQKKDGCPTCKRPFDAKSVEDYISSLNVKKGSVEIERAPLNEQVSVLQDKTQKLKALAPQLDNKILELRKQAEELRMKNAEEQNNLKQINDKIRANEAQLDSLQLKIKDHDSRVKLMTDNFHEQQREVHRTILSKEVELKIINDSIDKATGILKELTDKLEIAGKLGEVLGNSGVKSYIFDSVTPELNKNINQFLSILDPAISAEVSTIKKLKSGEMREKFDIQINNSNGGDSYGSNSGGEKAKVDLAIALAFNRLARDMSSDIGFIGLDEPFNYLDEQSSEAVVELLGGIDGSVFIISHDPAVKDIISNKILVSKSGGIATACFA